MIKKILPSILLGLGFVLVSANLNAQLNYTVSFPAATYTALPANATHPTLSLAYPLTQAAAEGVPATDEGAANNLTLPFPFKFNGTSYTTYHINSNGFIALGSQALDTFDLYYINNLATGPYRNTAVNSQGSRPIIAPLWDDLDLQAGTNLSIATAGTTPNRIFTIQWSNAKWTWQGTAAAINFQVKLYEADNSILFHYKTATGALSTGASASIGLADAAIGTGNFLSMSGVTNAATNSYTTETTTIATKPANNFAIKFIPTAIPAFDASISGLTAPSAFVSCFNTIKTVQVTLTNSGTTTIAPGAASVNLRSIGINANNVTVSNATAIPFKGTEVLTFNLNLNAPTTVSDSLIGLVTLTGDSRAINDTVRRYSSTAGAYTAGFPINDGGDLTAIKWRRNVYGGSNGWVIRNTSYINSALGDSLYANSGKDYYLFNTVASAALTSSFLYTNCMDIPAGLPSSSYSVSFYMSHDSSRADQVGTDNDSLYIVASSDRGQTWTRLGGFSRILAGFDLPTYQKDSVDISAYAGQTIQLGLEGVGYYGNVFGVDDIVIAANYPLPIKLNSFIGTKEGNKNVLNWQTANEINNKGFELQRSINGKEFNTIAYINSKAENGSSAADLNYSYSDDKYFAATNYYRLKQLDKDGKSSFSNVVVLKSAITKIEISRMYPNPVQEKLNIVLTTPSASKVTVNITDLVGKTIASKSIETIQGDNIVLFNTDKFVAGTYLVKVLSANAEIASQKFIKQ
jgi:hypothetical protein